MSGNREGSKKAVATIKAKYGEDFFKRIGKLQQESWERNGRKPRGFAANHELARIAGAKGGAKSKRTKKQ